MEYAADVYKERAESGEDALMQCTHTSCVAFPSTQICCTSVQTQMEQSFQ